MAYCVTGNYSIQNCLGIGVETPTYGVDVRGTGVGTAAIALNNTSANGREWAIYSTGNNFSQGCGGLLFYRAWCDGGGGSMYIDCLGRVGIGTTAPATHNGVGLVVSGAGTDKRGIIEVWDSGISNAKSVFQNVGGDTYIGQLGRGTGNGDVYLLTGGNGSSATISMYIKCSGNVGINTTSPNEKLQVAGAIAATGTATTSFASSATMDWFSTGARFISRGANTTTAGTFTFSIESSNSSVTSNAMVIGNTGNVGIGITDENPLGNGGTFRNLLVGNGAGYGVFQGVSTATATNSTIVAFSGGTTGASNAKNGGSINLELDATSTTNAIGRWAFYTRDSGGTIATRMTISSGGNVGIGTTSPGAIFHVSGSADVIMRAQSSGASSTVGSYYITAVGGVAKRYYAGINVSSANGAFEVYDDTCASSRLLVSSIGNVGVGITTPCAPLSFNNVEGNKIDFYYTVAGSGDRYGIQVQTSELRIHSGAAGASTGGITFGKQSTSTFTEAMRVTNAGCVGIGTATPSYRLHVNGTFYAAGSSIKYKEGICNYDTNSCLFMCLKPVSYQYKDEFKHLGKELKADTQIGLIAEDVAEVMPELAVLVNEEDEKVVRNVDYEKLSIVLLSELQKLRKEVDELKNNK